MPRRNDIILCRNVMIYFDEAEQKRLIEKFWHLLESRRLSLRSATPKASSVLRRNLRMVHENNGTAYQKVEANS